MAAPAARRDQPARDNNRGSILHTVIRHPSMPEGCRTAAHQSVEVVVAVVGTDVVVGGGGRAWCPPPLHATASTSSGVTSIVCFIRGTTPTADEWFPIERRLVPLDALLARRYGAIVVDVAISFSSFEIAAFGVWPRATA